MDFVKVRRRISYRERMQRLLAMLNKSQTREVTLRALVKQWQLTPSYVKKLMRWCAETYDHIAYDENYSILFFKSPASPTYRGIISQTQLAKEGP